MQKRFDVRLRHKTQFLHPPRTISEMEIDEKIGLAIPQRNLVLRSAAVDIKGSVKEVINTILCHGPHIAVSMHFLQKHPA